MKLLIRRDRNELAQFGTTEGAVFAVSFQLALLPEERHWVEQLWLFDKWVAWPEICPDGNKCTTPRWTLREVLHGVQLQPPVLKPAVDCYNSLRQVLHAEADVERGCELLAATLDGAESYQGVREISYGADTSDPAR